MGVYHYNPGDTITLSVPLIDERTPANNPVTGETVKVAIRRGSDDYWWDFVASDWDNLTFATLEASNWATHDDKGDGSYETDWNQAATDASAVRTYFAIHRVTTGSGDFDGRVDEDQLVFDLSDADTVRISGDSAVADALETMLNGVGGNVLTLSQLRIVSAEVGGAIDIDNSAGSGIVVNGGGIGGFGIEVYGAGGNAGIYATGGPNGHGLHVVGGTTSGDGLRAEGGTFGAGDGIDAVGTGGQVDIRGDIVGNLTGDVSGSVGSIGDNGISAASLAAAAIAAIQSGLATVANQTTILNRIGAWTGTARNTILGALQALFRSDADATVPSDVNADLGGGVGTADNTEDSNQAIRNRGDIAWITGGGGSITQIIDPIPNIPNPVDLADTATWRIAVQIINSLDDLPSGAEITPGTISIDRKASGATTWTAVVTDAAMLESAGLIYYDEVFDSGTGYAQGDLLRITLKSQAVVADANTYEIFAAGGAMFYSRILGEATSGYGANTVNITVSDGTDPVPGARVYIKNTETGDYQYGADANTNGVATFQLDDGTYWVKVNLAGYTHTAESIAVDESPESITITISGIGVVEPPEGDAIRVYAWPIDLGLEVDTSTTEELFSCHLNAPALTSSGVLVSQEVVAQRHASGYWYVDVAALDDLDAVDSSIALHYTWSLRNGKTIRKEVNTADGPVANLISDLD